MVDHEHSGTLPYSQPIFMATLFWSEQNLSQSFSYLKNPFDMATPLIQPDFCGVLVTGFIGFHCMPDGPLMLQVNLPVVDAIRPQSNKFVTDVMIKATCDSKVY